LGYLVLAILILTIPDSRLLLPLFFVVFALAYIGHGAGSVPRFDVIGKAVPASTRGSFFARSNLIAGIVGFGAGFIVQALLRGGADGPPVQCYAWLLLLSIVFYLLAIEVFRRIREHDSAIHAGKPSIWRTLREIPTLLKGNDNYRRLVNTLVLTDLARRVTDPFYIIFATEILGVPVYYAGVYLSVLVFSKIVSNVLWDYVSRWLGNRRILQLSSAAGFAVPALTLAFASLGKNVETSNGIAFAWVFVLMGVRDSGKYIGKRSVFLDIVSEEDRPIHWGTLNSLIGLISFLPVLAGTLIDSFGYTITFGLVSLVSFFGFWTSLRIRAVPDALEPE